MQEILTYIKEPIYIKKQKFEYRTLVKAIILSYVFTILSAPLRFLLGTAFNLEKIEIYNTLTPLHILLITTLVPLIEEFISRFFLRPTRYKLTIYLIGLFTLSIFVIIVKDFWSLSAILIYLCLGSVLYYKRSNNTIKFYHWYLKNFKTIFYLSCILFGVFHVINYNFQSDGSILLLSVMILPQIFTGALLGFMRMKYGIIFSILLHSCLNILALLPQITQMITNFIS